jgi:hypothetical protein
VTAVLTKTKTTAAMQKILSTEEPKGRTMATVEQMIAAKSLATIR